MDNIQRNKVNICNKIWEKGIFRRKKKYPFKFAARKFNKFNKEKQPTTTTKTNKINKFQYQM